MPNKALIVVDMQNDFMDNGALPVKGALALVGPISNKIWEHITHGNPVIFTKDSHPEDHMSFVENGGTWPKHCVKDTIGQYLQFALDAIYSHWDRETFTVDKGKNKNTEEYSGFDNPQLHSILEDWEVDTVEICGVAREVCVEATAEAARKLGYNVIVLEELCGKIS